MASNGNAPAKNLGNGPPRQARGRIFGEPSGKVKPRGVLAIDSAAARTTMRGTHHPPNGMDARAMGSLEHFVRGKLADLEARSLKRTLSETARFAAGKSVRDGRDMISFCCNDYLDLSHHPKVIDAAIEATRRYGAGSGASRLVTGNHPLYAALEARLARFKETEAAVVFGSGYLANIGIIPSLMGKDDLVLADELCHACLFAGSQLSQATLAVFRHNDLAHCEDLLTTHRRNHPHCLILTDGVFSMDGDLAPVAALADLAERHDSWLMTDDAHGLGVVGRGKGSSYVTGTKVRVPLQMGTLSKAVGVYGGYLCASQAVVDFIKTRARSFIYTTGLPPGAVAASIAALDLIETDEDLVARPMAHARLFTRALNLPEPESCIVPLILGDPDTALAASRGLAEQGFLVTAIRPPTVPAGTARLRFTFTAEHREEDIRRLVEAVRPFRSVSGGGA
jgi:8-amino-7-oxononanoate synthase